MPGEPFILQPVKGPTPPTRRAPISGPGGYQTWSSKPWWRQATCPEVDCGHWREGWVSVFDESSPLGRQQADYVRHHSGRRFRLARTPEGWTAFEFYPGQTCFSSTDHEHRVQADIPDLFVVQGGDWRGTAGKPRVYDRGDQFADDLYAHTDKIRIARSRAGTGN